MAKIHVQTNCIEKNMKPMHGGGQPPVTSAATDVHFHYLTEAGIPFSRLHDVGGAFGCGKYVDIPNIFRNFDADENDPANYDFTFTDLLLNQLKDAKVEPYFRLGVTIENAYKVKHYWISAPSDYQKWARICEHIIRHYTEGWADGFFHKITYWEIWGENDNYPAGLWQGTPEEFYELFDVTVHHLKSCFPNLMFGGYGHTSLYAAVGCKNPWNPEGTLEDDKPSIDFFHGFMEYCKAHNTPMDFYSWHGYSNTKDTLKVAAWVRQQLDAYGYPHIENHLTEWDPYWEEFGTAHHSAEIAAMMIGLQHGSVDLACIYDMRIANAPFCPLFSPVKFKPHHGYYSMVAFNMLYQLGNQIGASCDTEDLYVLAASNGKKHRMLVSNLTGKKQLLDLEGVDLSDARYYVLDQDRLLSWAPNAHQIDNNAVLLIEW